MAIFLKKDDSYDNIDFEAVPEALRNELRLQVHAI